MLFRPNFLQLTGQANIQNKVGIKNYLSSCPKMTVKVSIFLNGAMWK